MPKRPEITEQTRANLQEAFLQLYAEKPMEKISVQEIARRAGYNRATFYLYYHDVYELRSELEDMILGGLEALINNEILKEEDLDFSAHMGIILQIARHTGRYSDVFLGERADPEFIARFKGIIAPVVDRFLMPEEGLLESERRFVREFYLSGLIAAICQWSADADAVPIEEFIRVILQVAGIAGP